MDALIVLMRLLLPLVAILIYAPFTPHPLKTIALLEALIAFFVLLSWASITIQVEGDVIREIRFFLKSNLHHLRDIQRVSMTTEVGSVSLTTIRTTSIRKRRRVHPPVAQPIQPPTSS